MRQLLRGRQAVGAEVSAVGDAQLDARQLRAELVLAQHVHRHARDECGHAQERRALRFAHLRQFLVGRVADAHARIEPAHLDFSQLRVLHLAPLLEDAPLVHFLVPLRERDEILAVEARVDVDERLLLLDADLREEIPELDHVGEAAALVIGVVGEIALQRRLGLVEELVESAHRRIAGEFLGPRLDLAKHREVALVHLVVGLVAQRPDENAAESVEVKPRHDLRVLGDEVENRACLRRAARIVTRALLLVLRRPRIREVAVEVVLVVGEEIRVRNAAAVEIDDAPLGIELVVRRRILGKARHHDARVFGELDELAVVAHLAHEVDFAVAVEVVRLPIRVALVAALVQRARANVAPRLQHRLRAIGRDARHDIEERVPDGIRHMGWDS